MSSFWSSVGVSELAQNSIYAGTQFRRIITWLGMLKCDWAPFHRVMCVNYIGRLESWLAYSPRTHRPTWPISAWRWKGNYLFPYRVYQLSCNIKNSTGVHGKKWSEPLCSGDVRTISWYNAPKKFGGRPMSGRWRRHPPPPPLSKGVVVVQILLLKS